MTHVLNPISGKEYARALQIVAHNLCNKRHPEEQINMTGFMGTADGVFIVSCAFCKMDAYEAVRRLMNDAEED